MYSACNLSEVAQKMLKDLQAVLYAWSAKIDERMEKILSKFS